MIFFKKDPVLGVDLESSINNAVFPGLQGGSHNHTIGGLAVCSKHAQSAEFKAYQEKGIDGARAEKILDMASITPSTRIQYPGYFDHRTWAEQAQGKGKIWLGLRYCKG